MPKKHRRYPLWACIGGFLLLLIGVIGLAFSYSSYKMVQQTTISATKQLSEEISDITELTVLTVQQQTHRVLDSLAKSRLSKAKTLEERMPSLPYLAILLRQNQDIDSIYTGYDNGDFFYVTQLAKSLPRNDVEIPEKTVFWALNIENAPDEQQTVVLFFDKEMALLRRQTIANEVYDPRNRGWYKQAIQGTEPISTAPYFYFHSNAAGVTYAQINAGGDSVVGVDTRLDFLVDRFKTLLPTASSRILLFKPDGSLVANIHNTTETPASTKNMLSSLAQEDSPVFFRAREEYRNGTRGMVESVTIDGQKWFLFLRDLTNSQNEVDNVLLLAMPLDEIMDDAEALLHNTIKLILAILVLTIPIAWLMAQYAAKPLRLLAEQATRIREFRFDDNPPVVSSVKEIDILARTLTQLKESITRFLSINLSISSERDFRKLLETILSEILDVANAHGGAICLLDDNGTYRPDVQVHWKNQDGSKQHITPLEYPQILLPRSDDFYSGKTLHTSISRQNPLAALDIFAPAFTNPETHSLSIIHIPLRNSSGVCLGALSLFMQMKSSQARFDLRHIAFSEALASTAAIALENQRLLEAHDNLLDALVKIIAGAIDAKSPYTGGHCQRVPVIFDMLLNAACQASEGPFKDFTLTEDERREAYLAAWLHDCGKVTTPEYVVDKATKLETIYDRIHEVRTRFEVLKRDAEISCLKDILDGAAPETREQQLAAELEALDNDFAFIAQCNMGSEFLDTASIERLEQIASRSWMRTLDNRLGVSHTESKRIGNAQAPLPVREPLLADRPEHIIPRESAVAPSSIANQLDCTIENPADLYNRGEIYNLRISQGTLNGEERYKINEHIVQTIIMLKNLPLPSNLKNIPEIAGNHHETLDGKGYPCRLTQSDLSIKSRMMAIADIFEALTASDRPYKPRKALSEVLVIMKAFKDRRHLDPDLYELFIASNIATTYAEKYLDPEQCDM